MKRILSLLVSITLLLNLTLTSAHANTSDSTKDTYEKLDAYLEEASENSHIPGMAFIIVDKDSVLFSNTYGDCENIDTPFLIGSMSKSFTAVAIMKLVEEGRIRLEDKASIYLPDYNLDEKVTIKHLLNHTSGFSTYQKNNSIEVMGSYGKFVYSNVNYNLLGEIIENVSGLSYEEYIKSNIFKPIGMTNSAASVQATMDTGLIDGYRNFFGIPIPGKPDYPNEKSWSYVSAGYISSSASDMGKYLQMYLNQGMDVLSPSSINTLFYDNVIADEHLQAYYGMGWFTLIMSDTPVMYHSGLIENFRTSMFILPDKQIGIVLLTNMNDYLGANNLVNTIDQDIVSIITGKEPIGFSKYQYIKTHFLLDAIYLSVFLVALFPLVFIKRYKKKLALSKKLKTIILILSQHVLLPMALLLIPRLLSTPMWVVRYFVPDLFIVLIVSASLLLAGGLIKIYIMFRTPSHNQTNH